MEAKCTHILGGYAGWGLPTPSPPDREHAHTPLCRAHEDATCFHITTDGLTSGAQTER
jgi:hypothetical protein